MSSHRSQHLGSRDVPVALVVSPVAAELDDARSPRRLLERAGLYVGEQIRVEDLDAVSRARKPWRAGDYRAVIAAGGDGTVGTTASAVAESGIPLGILPMGTSNNTARALGIPLDPAAAAAVIASGVPAAIDAGLVAPAGSEAQIDTAPAQRNWLARLLRRRAHGEQQADTANSLYFLHAATVGLNVEFARLATASSRRAALGGLTYPASSFEALLHLQSIAVSVQLSGVAVRTGSARPDTESNAELLLAGDVLQLAVVNTPVFGGSLNLRLPRVDAHDRLLDVVLVEPPRLNNVSQIVEKLHLPLRPLRHLQPPPADQKQGAESRPASDPYVDVLFPGVRRYQARAVAIATVEPVDVTLDGEVRARTPIDIRVAPAAVAVLLPPAWASALAGNNGEASSAAPMRMPS
jgi:diacylglycerol kinase (ATP)